MSFFNKILDKVSGKNVLYYPGCLTKVKLPEVSSRYENILKKIGIDFIKLNNFEVCCGSPVLRAGYRKDFEDLKIKNIQIFKKYNIGTIITNCPACYSIFKNEYKLENFNIKIKHITEILFKRGGRTFLKKIEENSIFYHDPCHLGRFSNIYIEPRQFLKNLGYDVKELLHNKENSMCCGSGGGLRNNNKDLSMKIANYAFSEAKEGTNIVSPCPMCYLHFKESLRGINVYEFSELFE